MLQSTAINVVDAAVLDGGPVPAIDANADVWVLWCWLSSASGWMRLQLLRPVADVLFFTTSAAAAAAVLRLPKWQRLQLHEPATPPSLPILSII